MTLHHTQYNSTQINSVLLWNILPHLSNCGTFMGCRGNRDSGGISFGKHWRTSLDTWRRATALTDDEREAEVSTEKRNIYSAFLPADSNKPSFFFFFFFFLFTEPILEIIKGQHESVTEKQQLEQGLENVTFALQNSCLVGTLCALRISALWIIHYWFSKVEFKQLIN